MGKKRWIMLASMLVGALFLAFISVAALTDESGHNSTTVDSRNLRSTASDHVGESSKTVGGADYESKGLVAGYLDGILSRVSLGHSSVKSLIDSFDRVKDLEDKQEILHKLSGAYRHFSSNEDNERIRAFLRKLIYSSEQSGLSRLAALLYGRLEISDDTVDILNIARTKGILTEDDYFAEIAFLISEEALFRQSRAHELMREVINNDSELARVRLISEASSPVFLQNSSDAMKEELLNYILENKPTFSKDYGVAGLSLAVDYEQWVAAQVSLKAKLTGGGSTAVIIDYYKSNPIEDHREALVLFSSPVFDSLSETSGGQGLKSQVEDMAAAYSYSYPDNPLVQRIEPEKLSLLVERHKKNIAVLLRQP